MSDGNVLYFTIGDTTQAQRFKTEINNPPEGWTNYYEDARARSRGHSYKRAFARGDVKATLYD